MVVMETVTVIKFKFQFLVYIFKLFRDEKFYYNQIMEENVIRNWNLSIFLFLTTLTGPTEF